MNKKLFLTSLTAIAIAMPAMAEDFPSSGLMQENKTYTEAANHDNMGVYEGTVTANAEYDWDIITVNPGYYVPANSTTAAQCTTGNYCEGIPEDQQARTPHYQSTVQGLTQCPVSHSQSAAGADAATDCYRTCTTSDVAHSTAVTGMRYYNGTDGDGVNACEPTSNGCTTGYHYVAAVAAPNLTQSIGVSEAGSAYGYISNNGQNTDNESTYGLSQNGTFVVDYGDGKKISGKSQCSTQSGTNNNYTWTDPTISATLPDSTGDKCYCQLDGYTLNGGAMQSLSAPWVFVNNVGGAVYCARDCAYNCAAGLRDGDSTPLAFRAAVFGSIESTPTPAMCAANTITITWNGASAADISANNAGTATYDGDIRTPRAAEQITGKTFKGWKFVKPQN